MRRLIEAGLLGSGLVKIETPARVARYNTALERLGIPATALQSFQIDGMGWSPEVAAEKRDQFYLTSGGVLQSAIVVTPDQKGGPIYMPFTSYVFRLMREYFDRFDREIPDVTTTHAIALVVDPEVSRYKSPLDLLYVDRVVVRSDIADLFVHAQAQQNIVKDLLAEGDGWFHEEARWKLIDHAKVHGDLRYRNVHLPDYPFTAMSSFYSEGFGGVMLFREHELMLVRDEQLHADLLRREASRVLSLTDPELLTTLIEKKLVAVNVDRSPEGIARLESIKDCIIAELIFEQHPDAPLVGMNLARKRSLLGRVSGEKREFLDDLERLIVRLGKNQPLSKGEVASWPDNLKLLFAKADSKQSVDVKETVPLVLSCLRSYDPYELYMADINRFVTLYRTWSDARKDWAVERIRQLKH